MANDLRPLDPTTPTGESEFKLRGLLSNDLAARGGRPSLPKLLRLVEKNMIVDTLQRVDGNQKAAGEGCWLAYQVFGQMIRAMAMVEAYTAPEVDMATGRG